MSDAPRSANLPDTCSQPAGKLRPVVDPAKCEAKADCVAVCPVAVFRVERIRPEVFRRLPATAKLKVHKRLSRRGGPTSGCGSSDLGS
jgi:NAD-dependent dihydropyrimidine dehydrogenase PreA subunit